MPSEQPAQSQDGRAFTNDQTQVFPMMLLPLTVLFGQQECGGSAGGHGGRMCSIQGPVKTGITSKNRRKERRTQSGLIHGWAVFLSLLPHGTHDCKGYEISIIKTKFDMLLETSVTNEQFLSIHIYPQIL